MVCKTAAILSRDRWVNPLAPGRYDSHFKDVIFKQILAINNDILSISFYTAFRLMWLDLIDGKSALGQLLVWCRQATNHYLNQCLSIYMMPYDVFSSWIKR